MTQSGGGGGVYVLEKKPLFRNGGTSSGVSSRKGAASLFILEALFKRHFWVVHVVGLAIVAFLFAKVANHGVSVFIQKQIAAQGGGAGALPGPVRSRGSGGNRSFSDASEQNIFDGKREEKARKALGPIAVACNKNSDCARGSVCRKNPDTEEGAAPKVCQADNDPNPGDIDCTASELSATSLHLIGVSVWENPENSLASIVDTSKGKKAASTVYSINDCEEVSQPPEGDIEHDANFIQKAPPCKMLPGDHKLVQIGIESVCLINADENRYELLMLEEPPEGAPKVAKAPTTPTKAKKKGGKNKFTDELAEGITKTGPNSYSLKQDSVNSALGNLSKLATQARIVPAFEGGESVGFKLFSIRPGSLYSKLGIQNGDVISGVNGYELNDPGKAFELMQKLKDGKEFSLEVKRRGKPVAMEYRIDQ